MRRRQFAAGLAGAAIAWPLAGRAQQAAGKRRIGVLLRVAEDDPDARRDLEAFHSGLRKLGWIVDHNVRIDYRYASADPAQMRAYAAELVGLPAEVVLAGGSLAVAALRRETGTMPIVFVRVADPLIQGFVASLAHPGGNVTGFTSFEYSIVGKWVDLLREVVPDLLRVALMFNPKTAPYGPGFLSALEILARSVGLEATGALVDDAAEIEGAVATLEHGARGGLIVLPDAFTDVHREQIMALTARHRVPTVTGYRYFTAVGGLISYGVDSSDIYRRAAAYVDRILKGEKPADLPVQRPTKFELVINQKAAHAMGVEIPPLLLARADEVIE